MTDTLIYHLPFNGKVLLPDSICRNVKYGRYQLKFRCERNTITVFREFLLYAGIIPLDEYNDFYNFLVSIKTDEKRKILIRLL
jgi:hypothetical protein